jgi:serine phosphatase RsbU (regulator of sigma subunit)
MDKYKVVNQLISRIFSFFLCLAGFVFFFYAVNAKAQNKFRIDSIEKALEKSTADNLRLPLLNALSSEVVDLDPDKAIRAAKQALVLAEATHNKLAEAEALRNLGYGYYNQASFKTALTSFLKALQIQESLKNKIGILAAANAVGNLYIALRQPDEALKYFNRTLALSSELKLKRGQATSLIGMGSVYADKRDFKLSLSCYFESLKLFQEINEKEAVATAYNNIANVFEKQKDYAKALVYITKALTIQEETGNLYGISLALNNIAFFHKAMGNYDQAIVYYTQGMTKALQMGANDRLLESYKGLSACYKKEGKYKEALKMNELCLSLNDTVFNKESARQVAEMQARFDTEKKEQQIGLLTRDQKIKQIELGRRLLMNRALAIGGALLLLLALVAIRANSLKRKVNAELAIKKQKIENAYNIIEEQHKDIKDSIRYAKRIQEAILPTVVFRNTFGSNGFVLFKPKDIVSGDFFWINNFPEIDGSTHTLLAAVDCTGHGVPGAFMSIVGNNLLNQAVKEHKLVNPALVLNDLNINLSQTLQQTAEESTVKDGMDIALCSIRKTGHGAVTLDFAGANNPVWIFRNSSPFSPVSPGFEELKGDKFPIGIFEGEELQKFRNHSCELLPGDTFYVFTDGFADQFGGPKGKKFKYKPLKELLQSIQDQTMLEQQVILEKAVSTWRGDLEQVDDILIVGIRV